VTADPTPASLARLSNLVCSVPAVLLLEDARVGVPLTIATLVLGWLALSLSPG
jgi:hypothetical protein